MDTRVSLSKEGAEGRFLSPNFNSPFSSSNLTDVEKRENPVCHFVTPLDGNIDMEDNRPAEVTPDPAVISPSGLSSLSPPQVSPNRRPRRGFSGVLHTVTEWCLYLMEALSSSISSRSLLVSSCRCCLSCCSFPTYSTVFCSVAALLIWRHRGEREGGGSPVSPAPLQDEDRGTEGLGLRSTGT